MRKPLLLSAVLGLLVALSACTTPAGGDVNQPTAQTPTTTVTVLNTTATASRDVATSTVTGPSVTAANTSVAITREQAIVLALQAAGLARDTVFDLEADLDRERGNLYWEVDFETREYEYSYDIHVETGAVAKVERERND